MKDKAADLPQAGLLRDISNCLGTLGTPEFPAPFFNILGATAADQIMVFSYRANHAQCLLSRNFIEGRMGRRLAADYLDGWFLQDPLYTRALDLPEGASEFHRIEDILPRVSEDYRQRFFCAPNIEDKMTALTVGRQRLAVSLYWQHRSEVSQDLLELVVRLVQLHFDATPPSSVPPALQVLSPRERDICVGMLAGKKAELIAHELGIKPTSVATYRLRAYQKLGINSRGELFAICRS